MYKNEYDTYLEEVALEVDGLIVGNHQVKDHFVEQVDELLTMVTQNQTPDPILWFSWNPAFSTVQRKPNKQEYLMCQYVRLAVIHDAICSPVEDAQIFNENLVSRYGRWQVYNNVFVRLECAIRCNPFFPDCAWYDTQRRLVAESLDAVKRDLLQQGLLQNEVKPPTAVEETALVEVKSNLVRTKQNGKKVKLQSKEPLNNAIRDQVFICYSHKDDRWLNDLQTHLKPYVRNGSVTAWSDKQIVTGSKWFPAIKSALDSSKVAVLLVTPDFLASDFIHEHELGPLLKKAEKSKVKIIWIPVRACAYKETPLKDYQAAIESDKPLANMKKADRDKAWVKICEEIKRAVLEK